MSGESSFSIRVPGVGLREARDLVAELEVLQDVLDVGREAVEVRLEVGLELLLASTGLEIAQGELRGIVESLARSLPKSLVLIGDLGLVERRPHIEHSLLGRLEHGVEAAQDGHGQDHVTVLATDVEIAEDVVRNPPDEIRDPVEVAVAHRLSQASRPARSPSQLPRVARHRSWRPAPSAE
jgi:hypothetical protein